MTGSRSKLSGDDNAKNKQELILLPSLSFFLSFVLRLIILPYHSYITAYRCISWRFYLISLNDNAGKGKLGLFLSTFVPTFHVSSPLSLFSFFLGFYPDAMNMNPFILR